MLRPRVDGKFLTVGDDRFHTQEVIGSRPVDPICSQRRSPAVEPGVFVGCGEGANFGSHFL